MLSPCLLLFRAPEQIICCFFRSPRRCRKTENFLVAREWLALVAINRFSVCVMNSNFTIHLRRFAFQSFDPSAAFVDFGAPYSFIMQLALLIRNTVATLETIYYAVNSERGSASVLVWKKMFFFKFTYKSSEALLCCGLGRFGEGERWKNSFLLKIVCTKFERVSFRVADAHKSKWIAMRIIACIISSCTLRTCVTHLRLIALLANVLFVVNSFSIRLQHSLSKFNSLGLLMNLH